MNESESARFLRELLSIHEANLEHLRKVQAKYGDLVPLHVLHQIEQETREIDKIKAGLSAISLGTNSPQKETPTNQELEPLIRDIQIWGSIFITGAGLSFASGAPLSGELEPIVYKVLSQVLEVPNPKQAFERDPLSCWRSINQNPDARYLSNTRSPKR